MTKEELLKICEKFYEDNDNLEHYYLPELILYFIKETGLIQIEDPKGKIEEANKKLNEIMQVNNYHYSFVKRLKEIKDLYNQAIDELQKEIELLGG
jgi:hypothetical protein